MNFTSFKVVATSVLFAALTACGGASSDDPSVFQEPHQLGASSGSLAVVAPPTIRMAVATHALDATSFLNWAETTYPSLFEAPQSNKTINIWTYRYYPKTDIYLGTNTSGDVLGLMGRGDGQYDSYPLGKLADFGCSVYPADCATVNAAPVANAGVAQNVVSGSVVTLDGSASTDVNNDPLTYAWTLTSKPAGSSATLSSATSAKPTFTADVAGIYVASLTVNDGKVGSETTTTTVTVVPRIAAALGIALSSRFDDFCGIRGEFTVADLGYFSPWIVANCGVYGNAGSALFVRIQNNGSNVLILTKINVFISPFAKTWLVEPGSQTIQPGATVEFALPLWMSLEVTNAVATFSLAGEPDLVVPLTGSMYLP